MRVRVERHLRTHFGLEPARASVSFVGVDPIEILRFDAEADWTTYVTVGMSQEPMTVGDPSPADDGGQRAELLVQTHMHAEGLWRKLAVLAAAPAVEGVVYRDGMTVDLGTPLAAGSRCTGGVVTSSELPSVLSVGVEVEILRLVPATSTELAWSRVHGSPALLDRWASRAVDLLDLGRAAVELD